MARFLGMIIGVIINIIMIPIAVIIAIPMAILKARNSQKSRLLYTGKEQALLAKSQRAIDMDNNGLVSPDRDLLEVANCIEGARSDYQIIKKRERFDTSFSDFVIPRIYQCHVMDWGNVKRFFELSNYEEAELDELSDESIVLEDIDEIGIDEKEIVKNITLGVSSRIGSKKIALQFVLEELESAQQGDEAAAQFVKSSGFKPSEYEGATQNSFKGVDGPQQFLLSSVMPYSSDTKFMINICLQVIENIIIDWGLSRQNESRIDNLLKSLRNLLEDDEGVMPALTSNMPVPATAKARHIHFRQKNIDSAKTIMSTLSEITGDGVDTIIKNALQNSTREEGTATQDEIISNLEYLSKSNNVKTCKMTISPVNENWSWEFVFSDGELEAANELVSILYDLRNGDFIAPVYNIVKKKNSILDIDDSVGDFDFGD